MLGTAGAVQCVWCMTSLHVQGWSWSDEEWTVDTQGIADDAVDINGWSYAVNFGHLNMPPKAGSGKYRKVGFCLHLVHVVTALLWLPCM